MKIIDSRLRVERGLSVLALARVIVLGLLLLTGAGRPVHSTEPKPETKSVLNHEPFKQETFKQKTDAKDQEVQETEKEKDPARQMVVHVVDEEGKPIEGVDFFVNAATKTLLIPRVVNDNFTSNEKGDVSLKFPSPLTSARIWASQSGYVPLFFNWEEGDTENVPANYSLVLQRGTELGGIVVDSGGNPVANAKIDVSLSGGGTKVDPQERVKLNPWLAYGEDAAVSDAKGRWVIKNAPSGDDLNLRFQIVHKDFINDKSDHSMGHYVVTLDELREKTARFALKQGVEIRGRVLDDQGHPISKALVVWGNRPYWEQGSQEVLTDDNGEYRIPPQEEGAVRITVVAKDWMPVDRVINVAAGTAISEEFQLAKGKKLHLKFVDKDGKPIPDVYVSVDEWHGVEALYNHRHPNVIDSQIPRVSDKEGNYVWEWAPGDIVKLQAGVRKWKSSKSLEVVANDQVQTKVIHKPFALSGKVVDASTGQSIEEFSIVPITYRSKSASSRGIAQRQRSRKFKESSFGFDNAFFRDDGRVAAFRFQAVGYRDFTTERFEFSDEDTFQTIRLEPAPVRSIRILNEDGKPAKSAKVWIARPDGGTMMSRFEDYFAGSEGGIPVDSQGKVQYGAPDAPHAIVVASRNGYAEKYLKVDEDAGDLVLKPWSRLEGQLIQAGEPVPGATVTVRPIRQLGGDNPHVQDNFHTVTDAQGKFVFAQLPPVPVRVRSMLSPWRDYPITSSRDLPLQLQPGQTHQVSLGGEGLRVVGKVRLLGKGADEIEMRYGLNTLLRLEGGVTVPDHAKNRLKYQSGEQKNWQDRLYDGIEDQEGKENFFVKLRDDGTFLISGVQPGKYRFLVKMYEPPTGCLVEPVGYSFLEFSTSDYKSENNQLDLGTMDLRLKPFPNVGEILPDFKYQDSDGKRHQISELRGQFVLIDFWASWCQPCIKAIPDLAAIQNTIKDNESAMMIGISVDEDLTAAKTIVLKNGIDWPIGLAGNVPGATSSARALGINTVPTYLVLDPQGEILYRGFSHEAAAKCLQDAIK